jgi:hypothetical protein
MPEATVPVDREQLEMAVEVLCCGRAADHFLPERLPVRPALTAGEPHVSELAVWPHREHLEMAVGVLDRKRVAQHGGPDLLPARPLAGAVAIQLP